MKKVWKGIGVAILTALAMFMIEIIVSAGCGLVYGIIIVFRLISNKSLASASELTTTIVKALSGNALLLISVIGIIACGIVFFFWYRKEIKGEVRNSLRKVFTGKNIIMLVSLGIGMQLITSGIMSIAQQYFTKLFDDYAKQMEILTDGNIILVVVLAVVIAPFTEELVFRGVILQRTNRYVSFFAANIIQAVLFGIYHFNIVQGFYAAFLGLLLGAVYYKFRSIVACMFLHMTFNASSFLFSLLPDESYIYYILILTGGIILFAGLYLFKNAGKLVPDVINTVFQFNEPAYDNDNTGTRNT